MKQKEILYGSIMTVIILSTAYFSIQSVLVTHKEPIQEHGVANQQEIQLPLLAVFVNENGCFDLKPQQKEGFNTQSYRSEVFKDDNLWLINHFNSAFTQGEGGCGSNSLSTALYGQKAMISRFVQELDVIEKKKGKNAQYDYVRAKALELQAVAMTKNMRQGQWLDNYGNPQDTDKRALTMIDGLEAFFPNKISTVKSRKNTGYTVENIYIDSETTTNGYEFIDNTINLSLPLNSTQRGFPWWAQDLFKEFVMRNFDAYDAQMYLAPKTGTQDPYFNNASLNPTLETGKTMYATYKEWLLNYKKFKPYVSNLEKMHGSTQTTPGGVNNNNNNSAVTNPNNAIQDDPHTIVIPIPKKPIDKLNPINDPSSVIAPNKGGGAIIVPLPPKAPENENKTTDSLQSLYKISLPLSTPEQMRVIFDATIEQQSNSQNIDTVVPITPATRSLRF